MARQIAFLRAINVGNRRVKMDRLRGLFEDLGFEDVSTHIASGNVIFDPSGKQADLEKTIESHLESELGYEVLTFLRTPSQLAAVVARAPFGDVAAGHTHMVAFLRKKPSAAAAKAATELSGEKDELSVEGREVHWLIRGKSMDSELKPKALERALDGDPGTTRNTTMLRKLHAKLEG
jgi:uncharacterized protein (DUF1697 family)